VTATPNLAARDMRHDVTEPPRHRNLIDGSWEGERFDERRDPADPERLVALIAHADAAAVKRAVDAARHAWLGWAQTPAPQRGRILAAAARVLDRRRSEIARTISDEEGKTRTEALAEVGRAIDYFDFFAAEGWRLGAEGSPSEDGDQIIQLMREPIGVVGLITPWNFPCAIPAWKLAPALVAGNTVVLKPASLAPGPALALVDALREAGLPDGVVNVVHGDGLVGDALVSTEGIDAISFTGSNAVGQKISDRIGGRPVRLQLELGGVNALVVLADADLDHAADLVVRGAFGQSGQACTATRQVLSDRRVLSQLEDLVAQKVRRLNSTPGAFGPMVSSAAADQVESAVLHAVHEGARVLVSRERAGQSLGATVLTDVEPSMAIARDEVFGPVVSMIAVDGLDDAVGLVNASRFGLVAGIATRSLKDAMEFAKRVRVGTVKINRTTPGNQPNVPFGGVKASSNGFYKEQGHSALEFFTTTKSVYVGW
jgi:aldehyde dehydrogenase (NAD+)